MKCVYHNVLLILSFESAGHESETEPVAQVMLVSVKPLFSQSCISINKTARSSALGPASQLVKHDGSNSSEMGQFGYLTYL